MSYQFHKLITDAEQAEKKGNYKIAIRKYQMALDNSVHSKKSKGFIIDRIINLKTKNYARNIKKDARQNNEASAEKRI